MNWSGTMQQHQTAATVVAGCVLAPVVELVKLYLPAVRGWKAVAVSLMLATIAVLLAMPDSGWVDGVAEVLLVWMGAAGVYGTGKSLLARRDDAQQTPPMPMSTNPLNTSPRDPQLR